MTTPAERRRQKREQEQREAMDRINEDFQQRQEAYEREMEELDEGGYEPFGDVRFRRGGPF